jgi:hypothetical protein
VGVDCDSSTMGRAWSDGYRFDFAFAESFTCRDLLC